MAKLVFIGEKFAGRVFEFTVTKTTVGRGDHNTLTIHDASVSLNHCEIYAYGEDVIVHDLGSSNGTFVNGERLHNQQRPLAPGQTVRFGSVEARLEAKRVPASDTDVDTDVTAVHAHARWRTEQSNPKPAAPNAVTLDAGTESPTDHTFMLPRPPEVEKASTPPKAVLPEKSSSPIVIAIALSLVALVLALIVWMVWGRS